MAPVDTVSPFNQAGYLIIIIIIIENRRFR